MTFRNDLQANAEQNIFNYLYFYNGGGVALGDLDGDGLPEIVLTSNQGNNGLYLNKGDMQFEDKSGLLAAGAGDWSTGVTMADVNDDGRLDIYISVAAPMSRNPAAHNRLYLNESSDGHLHFREAAAEYGLDISAYGTQAAFFDYDRDGDLDCYLLNHSVHGLGTFKRRSTFDGTVSELAGDRLLRRDEDRYVEMSRAAGIKQMALGYGLGLSVADIDQDGWPDIYVGNDFHEDDYCYINQGDGSFRDELRRMMPHTSRFTMGTDIADLNNDGRPEIMSLDMLPDDPVILKAAAAEDPYDIWHMKQAQGYWPQFSRNNLQWNLGIPPGDSLPRFGDRAIQAGVYASDWSWAVLLEDFDQDGLRDIFISNGILGRSNDMDYINYVTEDENQARIKDHQVSQEDLKLADRMPVIKLPNVFFRNRGESGFERVSEDWGMHQSTFSHGAAYADLDGDGDLDLVFNNVNDEAGLYENQSRKLDSVPVLEVELLGRPGNRLAYGARLELRVGDSALFSKEVGSTMGFQSASDPRKSIIPLIPEREQATLYVYWPDGTTSIHEKLKAGHLLLDQADARPIPASEPTVGSGYRTTVAEQLPMHRENSSFVDFNREALIPQMVSREGPPLACIDLAGHDYLFVGGAKWQAAALYRIDGSEFEAVDMTAFAADSTAEDVDALVVDYDLDGLQDLLVLAGGGEFPDQHEAHRLRFYRQTSDGRLEADEPLDEPLSLHGSRLLALQEEGQWPQVFAFSRSSVNAYGATPPHYRIVFGESGARVWPLDIDWSALGASGMVRDAIVAELDKGRQAIVLSTEWGPLVRLYIEESGRVVALPLPAGHGFWSALAAADLDGDGDTDLLAGNLGLNSKMAATIDRPVRVYYADFDSNGKREQLITYQSSLGERLFATREEIIAQLPGLRTKVPDHTSFAQASLTELIDPAQWAEAQQYTVDQSASIWLEQTPQGWQTHLLPHDVQSGPIDVIVPTEEGDFLLFGQDRGANIQRGHYDAAEGWLLPASWFKQGGQEALSSLYLRGRVRDAVVLPFGPWLLSRNGQKPVLLHRE